MINLMINVNQANEEVRVEGEDHVRDQEIAGQDKSLSRNASSVTLVTLISVFKRGKQSLK